MDDIPEIAEVCAGNVACSLLEFCSLALSHQSRYASARSKIPLAGGLCKSALMSGLKCLNIIMMTLQAAAAASLLIALTPPEL